MAYANGEPKDIPDSEREVFYTRNKRPVLDGGGVTPDQKLEKEDVPEILQSLNEGHYIFSFANQYVQNHPAPEDFESFSFEDFDAFTKYLTEHNFKFVTEKEKLLETLSQKDSNNTLGTHIDQIQQLIAKDKADDLQEHKDLIKDQIEAELAKRYFLQEGKTRQMLKNDQEVVQAIQLLHQPNEYRSILRLQ